MIKNMSFKNSFEQSAKEYLGLQGGVSSPGNKPTTVFTTGILEVDGALGRKVQLGADSTNNAYVDFKSRDGGLADYDSRIISGGGSVGSTAGEATLSAQASLFQVLCPIKLGSDSAPSFKLDFGSVVMAGTLNAQTPVVFTVGLFATNPYVFLTIVSPITNEANAQPVFVESLTPAGFNAQFIGTPNSTAPGTLCNWLALGV